MELLPIRPFLLHFTKLEKLNQFKANLSHNCIYEQKGLLLRGAFNAAELNMAIGAFDAMATMDGKATFPDTAYKSRIDARRNNEQLDKTG